MKVDKKPTETTAAPVVNERISATAVVVNCTTLNIRKAPSPKAEIIGTLEIGEKVVVNPTAKFDQYYEILASSGKKGYAMKKYLNLIDD